MSAIPGEPPVTPAGWRETFQAMPYLPVALVAVAGHMMLFGMLTPVMALYGQSFAVPDWQIGLMITVFAAGRLAADLPAGHVASRIGIANRSAGAGRSARADRANRPSLRQLLVSTMT